MVGGMVAMNEKKLTLTIVLRKQLLSEGNKYDHWASKYLRNQTKKEYLFAFGKELRDFCEVIQLPVQVTLTRIAPRILDYDNWVYTAKSFRDYIADLLRPGLAPGRADDNEKLIMWEYLQEKGKPKHYALKIEISHSPL